VLIPYYRAQGAGNDFLFSWRADVPAATDLPAMARAICHRNFGVGGDGWYLMSPAPEADAAIHLYNSDGSEAELSGNGTRCAAAVLLETGRAHGPVVRIQTGAGLRELTLIDRSGAEYQLEMAMGRPIIESPHLSLAQAHGIVDAAIIDVGNPQCSIDIATLGQADFGFDWQTLGAEIEAHPRFPRRTNVSFFSKVEEGIIEARFFERGAGATLSSGTGATGAAVAAQMRGLVSSPVTVRTQAGDLKIRWQGADVFLAGPAQVIARGEYYADLG
jgi:diaminopimelate epimerase